MSLCFLIYVMTDVYIGVNKKLRSGGRFGIPSTLIKNIKIVQGDLEGWQGYLSLYMAKEDLERWKWLVNIGHGQISYTLGVGKNGVDYAALTYSDPGYLMPITLFLYETPKKKLNVYRPGRGNTSYYDIPIPICNNLREIDKDESYPLPLSQWKTDFKIGRSYFICQVLYSMYNDFPLSSTDKADFSQDTIIPEPGLKIAPNFDMMLEDFEARVVIKGTGGTSITKASKKTKPAIGGTGKELLIIHPDAEDWLNKLFKWRTNGVFTGLYAMPVYMNPDYPIYQFDAGVLYEKTVEGVRDQAVWRCTNWSDYLESDTIKKIKQLYPGIHPSDIFMSDED